MRLRYIWLAGLVSACTAGGTDDGDGDTDGSTHDTDVAAGGTSASGVVGDVVVDVQDGAALAKILDQGGTRYLGVTIAQTTAECPSMVHAGGSTYLRLALTRTDGGTFAPGTYAEDDAVVTLNALTDSYGDTCADLGGAQLGGGPSTVTLTEVGDTIAGTFSLTMYRTSLAPENIGVVTGSFVASMCENYTESCTF